MMALARKRSAAKLAPKLADIIDAIADVGPVLPHAIEGEIRNRAGFVLETVAVGRYANLNNRTFADADAFEGLEDATFVLRLDGHGLAHGALDYWWHRALPH